MASKCAGRRPSRAADRDALERVERHAIIAAYPLRPSAGAIEAKRSPLKHIATMIIFELACTLGHRFEGWFASAQDFARQSKAEMVRCPACDDGHVAIVPSARVRVTKGDEPARPVPAGPTASPPTEAAMNLPAELLQKLRETIRNTENVGRRFPEEARKIHDDEVPARAIRGQASPEEAEALREEGIEFASLPPFLGGESH
jgi:hypothetical protein